MTGQEINQIPDAAFLVPEPGRQVIVIMELLPGDYQLRLEGVGNSNYEVTVVATDGQSEYEARKQGSISAGQSEEIQLKVIGKIYLPLAVRSH